MRNLSNRNPKSRFRRAPATIFAFAAIFLYLNACTVTKQSEYFKTLQQKDTTLKGFVSNDFESKIMKGDRISVLVSSINPLEDAIFNGASLASAGSGVSANVAATGGGSGYTVQSDGSIFLHRIGSIKAEGLTRKEFAKQVVDKLIPYLKEPIVQVNYLNHKLTVLGQVARPQVLSLPEEQISLLDALVLSGDLTETARRNNILVIREEGETKIVKHVNLEDNSVFSSPWYYVKPNDIILVSADTEKYVKEEKRRRLQTTLSLVASGASLLIIILDRIIK